MKKMNGFFGVVLLANLMICQPLVTFAENTETTTETSISQSDSATSETPTDSTKQTEESTQETTTTSEEKELGGQKSEETLIQQTFFIQKVFSSEKIDANSGEDKNLEGVNGSHYRVYDVSKLLEAPSEAAGETSVQELTTELTERARKLSADQLGESIAEGETQTIDGKPGVFTFTLEVPIQTKKAFFIENDKTTENATKSESFVVITPVCDENGEPKESVWIYPKSEPIEKEQAKELTKEVKQLPSTGRKTNWLENLWIKLSSLFVSSSDVE